MDHSIILYGSGLTAQEFLRDMRGGVTVLAVVDRPCGVGQRLFGMTAEPDTFLEKCSEPFDLVIASSNYDVVCERLRREGKLNNPCMGEIYAVNVYKRLPLLDTDTFIEDRQWKWAYEHFRGDYSHKVIDLLRESRGNPKAPPYRKIKDVWQYAGKEDYWKSVKGKNYHSKAVIIDCGAYIGDSIEDLVNAVGLPVEAYYAFEPMAESFKVLAAARPSGVKNFYPVQKATGRQNKTVKTAFNEENPAASSLYKKVETANAVESSVISLDSLGLQDMADTDFYIKMDIEGGEMEALCGAEKLIRAKRPNLAICLYHRTNDIFEIPQYIDSLDLGYGFYLTGGSHVTMTAVPCG